MDYRISSLESDVRRIRSDVDGVRHELTRLSGRVLELELERRRKKVLWEPILQALLMFLAMIVFVVLLTTGHPESKSP